MGNREKVSTAAVIALAAVAAAAGVGVVGNASVARAAYAHVSVADSSGVLGTQLSDYALGNSGQVTFNNLRDDGQYGVYRWNGSLQMIAETGAGVPGWTTIFVSPTINASGQVAFFGIHNDSETEHPGGIWRAEPTSSGGAINPIAVVEATQSTTGFVIGTDINDAGVVAYQRRTSGVSKSIHTSNGTSEQTILSVADSDTLGWWSINDGGQVAIAGTIGGVKTLRRNVTDVTPSSFTDFRSPIIQDDGDIYFAGTRSDLTAGVYKLTGTTLTTILDTVGDGFTGGFARSSANNDGDIAFLATPTTGGAGIYFLDDGAASSEAQRVIGVGDALFGSTVSSVLLAPRGLNDADQIAYFYNLSNGVRGIGVASVPEPASLGVLTLGAAARFLRQTRRGTRCRRAE